MADNKPQKNDSDVFDEDLDLETLDDEDDLGDEAWDEFDDGATDAEEVTEEGADEKAPKATGGKNSFLRKNFNLIVVGIVVAGGGLFFLSRMAMSPSTSIPAQQDTAYQADDGSALPDVTATTPAENTALTDAQGEMPPMPAPMNASPDIVDQSASSDIVSPAAPVAAEEETLTPMPGAETLQNNGQELAELAIEEVPATPAAPAKKDAPAFDFKEEAPAAEAPAITETTPAPTAVAAAPSVDPAALKAQEDAVRNLETSFTAKLGELEKKFADIDSKSKARSESTDEKLADLANAIESLEKRLNETAETAKSAKAKADAVPAKTAEPVSRPVEEDLDLPTPEKVKTPVAEKTLAPKKAAPKEEPAATPVKAKTSQWQMKSAQPGKAVLADKSTGDYKTVQVGDKVNGIGRITSISQENGRWVVRGTTGQISQ